MNVDLNKNNKDSLKQEILTSKYVKLMGECSDCGREDVVCIECQFSHHGRDHCGELVCLNCVEKCDECDYYFCKGCYRTDWIHK